MRWIIDRLEDALAMCEDENGEITPISRKKIPAEAREGDILREEDGSFILSPQETEDRRREMKKRLRSGSIRIWSLGRPDSEA